MDKNKQSGIKAKTRNIKLTVQYEGTRYHGWQKQETGDDTIQRKLEILLTKMCGETIEVQGSGRTDAGVHALGQIVNFHTSSSMSKEEILEYMNNYLPEDIAVIQIEEVSDRFHSRLSAKGKRYKYIVVNDSIPSVFYRKYSIQVPQTLNLTQMQKAAEYLCGEHDFKSFTSAKKGKKSTIRRINRIEIEKRENLIFFTFEGNGFLYHMVRILMGTLLEVGEGKRSADSIPQLLQAQDRTQAGVLVPAKGLTLEEVYY